MASIAATLAPIATRMILSYLLHRQSIAIHRRRVTRRHFDK
jgi:hypothetical protein